MQAKLAEGRLVTRPDSDESHAFSFIMDGCVQSAVGMFSSLLDAPQNRNLRSLVSDNSIQEMKQKRGIVFATRTGFFSTQVPRLLHPRGYRTISKSASCEGNHYDAIVQGYNLRHSSAK